MAKFSHKDIPRGKVEDHIGVSKQTKEILEKMKKRDPDAKESFEDVLRRILTDMGKVYT